MQHHCGRLYSASLCLRHFLMSVSFCCFNRSKVKTLHERIPLAGFSKLPSIPQIAKVKCQAGLGILQQSPRHCGVGWHWVLLGSSAWAVGTRGTWWLVICTVPAGFPPILVKSLVDLWGKR